MIIPTVFPAFLKSALRLHAEANAALKKQDEPSDHVSIEAYVPGPCCTCAHHAARPTHTVHNVDAALSDVVDATLSKHEVCRANGVANGLSDLKHEEEEDEEDDAVRSKYVRIVVRVAFGSGSRVYWLVPGSNGMLPTETPGRGHGGLRRGHVALVPTRSSLGPSRRSIGFNLFRRLDVGDHAEHIGCACPPHRRLGDIAVPLFFRKCRLSSERGEVSPA